MPTEDLVQRGGLFHGVQLWVNLPAVQKWSPRATRTSRPTTSVCSRSRTPAPWCGSSPASSAAWPVPAPRGPRSRTRTRRSRRARVCAPPWRSDFNALAYVLAGTGDVGAERKPVGEGQLAVFGEGGAIELRADESQDAKDAVGMEVLLLGGLPIREQVAWYGPFVMNTRDELIQAVEDYQAGRMGSIPPGLSRT